MGASVGDNDGASEGASIGVKPTPADVGRFLSTALPLAYRKVEARCGAAGAAAGCLGWGAGAEGLASLA